MVRVQRSTTWYQGKFPLCWVIPSSAGLLPLLQVYFGSALKSGTRILLIETSQEMRYEPKLLYHFSQFTTYCTIPYHLPYDRLSLTIPYYTLTLPHIIMYLILCYIPLPRFTLQPYLPLLYLTSPNLSILPYHLASILCTLPLILISLPLPSISTQPTYHLSYHLPSLLCLSLPLAYCISYFATFLQETKSVFVLVSM